VAVTLKLTTAPDELVASAVIVPGIDNVGGVVSTTVTVNEPVGVGGVAPSSQLTVVGPSGKVESETGAQLNPALS
jgi:hypothetical protein